MTLFGYRLVKADEIQQISDDFCKYHTFVDDHMVMMDSKGKSENGNYDPDELAALWSEFWVLYDKIRKKIQEVRLR